MTPPFPQQPSAEAGRQAASTPLFLILGRILRPHGVRGELRVEIATQFPERVGDLETVFIGSDPYDAESAVPFTPTAVRRHRDILLVTLEEITSREEADPLRGKLLMVALEDAVPLEAGEYYTFQILGARVITSDGEELGRIGQVLETGANDVFVVQGGPRGEVLIPDVPHVVVDIDIENQVVTIDPLPGLLPE